MSISVSQKQKILFILSCMNHTAQNKQNFLLAQIIEKIEMLCLCLLNHHLMIHYTVSRNDDSIFFSIINLKTQIIGTEFLNTNRILFFKNI